MSDLFEVLDADEFRAEIAKGAAEPPDKPATTRRKRAPATEPRNFTTWYSLPHRLGPQCTVKRHEEVQGMLTPQEKQYRHEVSIRMTFEISPGEFICRDCFLAEADKE